MFAICGPSTGRNCMQVNSNGIPHRTIMHKRQLKAGETEGKSGLKSGSAAKTGRGKRCASLGA